MLPEFTLHFVLSTYIKNMSIPLLHNCLYACKEDKSAGYSEKVVPNWYKRV